MNQVPVSLLITLSLTAHWKGIRNSPIILFNTIDQAEVHGYAYYISVLNKITIN